MEGLDRAIPILMYHHVNRYSDDPLTVSVERFDRQMAHLSSRYFSLFFDEIETRLRRGGRRAEPETGIDRRGFNPLPPIAVTFDDGYADAWVYAFPILKKYQVKATIFVNTAHVSPGQSCRPVVEEGPSSIRRRREIERDPQPTDFLSWPEMREMEKSGLVRIESHSHHHLRCDASLPLEKLTDELSFSKREIERHLEKECRYLAWPFGAYDARATAAAQSCGYRAVVTTLKGSNLPGDDPMQLRRITARNRSMAWFRLVLSLFASPFLSEAYLRIKKERRPLDKISAK